ncbi:hypothetical protein [Salimicrobium humidisoli]|uniref:Uncharacterized protein n=1 Tax=Salimicrobium humidisoli TaxID=2029857 RepID=A0ABX4HUN3_9BACI|nr:hypothetical protein [Salimicrobium humidisoli]PBB06946.1 hypothetical protein CKW00_00360 [Salimicrobium humidisoli]
MNNRLVAHISSLLEEEDADVKELIVHTITQVEEKNISAMAHAKKVSRFIDKNLSEGSGDPE